MALLALVVSGAAQTCNDATPGNCFEESSLLSKQSLRQRQMQTETSSDVPSTLAGKSFYFLVIDRFAKSGERALDSTKCVKAADWENYTGGGYCGGTINGIREKLDYIQGMGFDCLWITPPVASNSFMGYDAVNLWEINPHFGTKDDLKRLADDIHARKMCLVFDVVLNHMRPMKTNGKLNMSLVPFDKPEHYNQRGIKPGQSFADYVETPPGPISAFDPTPDSKALKNLVEEGKVVCGPSNPELTECACMPGNSGIACPSFDPQRMVEGWFPPQGDLNQTVPFVEEQLLKYVKMLVNEYKLDGLRLDTAIYIYKGFLSKVQKAAGIEILGEATVNNMTYQAGLMRGDHGERVLDGLLNFIPFYQVPSSFCAFNMAGEFANYDEQGTWQREADMRNLGQVLQTQLTSTAYESLDLMGNFVDNHDENSRLANYCKFDNLRMQSALTWVMLSRGIPIIYYGTEQGLDGHQRGSSMGQDAVRESLWQTHYNTNTWQYTHLAKLNRIRKQYHIGAGGAAVKNFTKQTMVFTRQAGDHEAWIFINNVANTSKDETQSYCPGPLPANRGQAWIDVLSGSIMQRYLKGGCFQAPDSEPKVLVLQANNAVR